MKTLQPHFPRQGEAELTWAAAISRSAGVMPTSEVRLGRHRHFHAKARKCHAATALATEINPSVKGKPSSKTAICFPADPATGVQSPSTSFQIAERRLVAPAVFVFPCSAAWLRPGTAKVRAHCRAEALWPDSSNSWVMSLPAMTSTISRPAGCSSRKASVNLSSFPWRKTVQPRSDGSDEAFLMAEPCALTNGMDAALCITPCSLHPVNAQAAGRSGQERSGLGPNG
eukprot:CAMPEP_0115265408 /NCGR_PEP_ID=MMETSP0270-20121206/50933_1 /TAXON_ID=71861 /ORGANISM="Scrippsiella trochoidea, Strain CCMP3099" /LENGTH=227 /DNA_ID=CAMNT_0002681465 /DNA_START=66 /DNA_END=747 /DNA_ORIENTATION=-